MKLEVVSPFPVEALPRMWAWTEPFRNRIADDFGPQSIDQYIDWQFQNPPDLSWAVYGDGELGGMITYFRLSPWVGTAHCLFKKDFQGKGIAPSACRVAIAQMFQTGIGKLIFQPMSGNKAIGSLLIYLGAKREGYLRSHTLVGGQPTNINLYGLLKEEFERNASSSDSSGNRRGELDHRRDSGRPGKDHDANDHAHMVTGNGRTNEPTQGLQQLVNVGSKQGDAANENGGAG